MPLVASKSTVFTADPPSCLSFSAADPTLLVVGTYTLHEAAMTVATKKTGTLELYRVSDRLTHIQSLVTPFGAVLDLKFSPHDATLLAVALSRGALSLHRVQGAMIGREDTLALFDENVLVLSLCFSPVDATAVGVTLSDGSVAVVDVVKREVRYSYTPHSLEAWTCEFSRDGRRLFSGGDDSLMVVHDLEMQVDVGRCRRNAHGAGVTAILTREGETVWSGSYDEVLRVWDLRDRMRVVEETGLGGGVWRLHETGGGRVLASCMHAGARVVGEDLSVVAQWEENESMNYGGHTHAEVPDMVASCSFYDKRVCIWSI